MLPLASFGQSTLTVNDGTETSSYVPIYGLWADSYLKCEYVIPAEDLADMLGGTISAMTFYLSTPATDSWGAASFQVFMKEVDATTIDAYTGTDDATIVYEGSLDGTQSEMNVEFTTPYTYNGGNLLVGVYNTTPGTFKSAYFYGVTATGACVQGYSSSSLSAVSVNQRNFLPKTTFTYTAGAPVACARPTDLTFSNVTANSVTLAWTAGGSETEWTLSVNGTEHAGITENPYTLTGLNPGTAYTVKVKANCSDEEVSTWSNTVSFLTNYGIPFIEPFANSSIPANWARYSGLLDEVMGGTATLSSVSSYWYFGTSNGVFDSHARLNIYGTTCKYWLVTPSLMMEDNVRLTFDLALTAYSGTLGAITAGSQGDDKFVVLITTDNGTTWEILRQYDNAGSDYVYDNIATEGEIVAIDLSSYAGQNIAVAFYGESTASGGDNNLHVDNVRIDYIPSCEAPTAVQVSDITATTANVSWTENNPTAAEAWTIEVNGEEISVNENPYTLTGLDPETAYTVRVKANCTSTDASEYSNTADFTTIPSCLAPTAAAAGSITATSAEISWTANSGETEWTIEVNGEEIAGITENPYTLNGLTPATAYTVKVKANCSATDASAWSNTVNFTTECVTVVVTETEPFVENFSNGGTCWTLNDYVSGTAAWTIATTLSNNGAVSSLYDGACAKFYASNRTSVTKLISPVMDLTALGSVAQLSFQMANAAWAGDIDYLKVYYRTSATEEWNEVAYFQEEHADWEEMSVILPDLSATYQFALEGISNWGYAIFIDDVTVGAAPSCAPPAINAVDDITSTSATIGWTTFNGETTWTIEVNGVETTGITENPYTLDNLTAATTYTVKVKANCTDDDESDWSAEVTFTTQCDAIVVTATNPYQEGFENGGDCWSYEAIGDSYDWWVDEEEDYAYEGTYVAIAPYEPGNQARFISPVFDLSQTENPVLTFYHWQPNYQSIVDAMAVYYRASTTDEWTLLEEYTAEVADWTMETFTLPDPSATYQISFFATGYDGNNVWLDLVSIFDDVEIPCATPTNVAFADGVVTWTGDAANYNVHIVAGETTIDTTVNTTSYTIEGLNDGDHATVTVQAICSEDDLSEWSEAVEFDYTVVVEPCATPTNVTFANGVVTWTGDAANYNVHIVAGETTIDTTVNTTTYTVEGLNNGDHATVTVQAICAEDDLSEWSEAVEFDYTDGINNYTIHANVYPNPTTGNVTIESNAINADITVFDVYGKVMMTSKVASERTELNFSTFAPGIYMVRIAETNNFINVKVVKK